MPITIATRKSPLALWQCSQVAQALQAQHKGLEIKILKLTSIGDEICDRPLREVGGKALFVSTLEQALLEKRADIAVHSLKDVPCVLEPSFSLSAILAHGAREDVLLSKRYASLQDLPNNASIGTCSLRRGAQLLHHQKDFNIQSIRGNIQTRIAYIEDDRLDAIIIAKAALERLDIRSYHQVVLEPSTMLAAPGQGAIAIEVLAENTRAYDLSCTLNHSQSATIAHTERAICAKLKCDCHSPIACYGTINHDTITVHCKIFSIDGKTVIESHMSTAVHTTSDLVETIAKDLLQKGARALLDAASK